MSLLKWLGLSPKEGDDSSDEPSAVREIVEALDRLDPDRARFLARFAYILGRVAHVDAGVSQEETRAMEKLVSERGEIPEDQAIIVVQLAKTQNLLFGGTENYIVTRDFKENSTRKQRLALLSCLFAVSASDETISSTEDAEVRLISQELGLEHRDFIAARTAFREYVSFLKKD